MKSCICSSTALPGSLMAQILAITPDQFVDPPKSQGMFEPLEERMNDFEKAVFTVMSQVDDQIKDRVDQIKAEEISLKVSRVFKTEISELKDKHNMLKGLLYFSIQDRLNLWNNDLGLSQGFKIVRPDESICSHGIAIELPGSGLIKGLLDSLLKRATEESAKKSDDGKEAKP